MGDSVAKAHGLGWHPDPVTNEQPVYALHFAAVVSEPQPEATSGYLHSALSVGALLVVGMSDVGTRDVGTAVATTPQMLLHGPERPQEHAAALAQLAAVLSLEHPPAGKVHLVGAKVVGMRVGKVDGCAVVGELVVGENVGLSVGALTAMAFAQAFFVYLHPVYVVHLALVSPTHVPDAGRRDLAKASTVSTARTARRWRNIRSLSLSLARARA